MKKSIVIIAAALLSTCSRKGTDAANLANEVCDCFKKANAMDAADPARSKAQSDCSVKQNEAWMKVQKDPEKADEFNNVIGNCSREMMRKSFSN
jgi:hypothetical protein